MKCAVCGCEYGIEIHHIIPRILGGTDDPSNLEPLCSSCHKKKHLENRSELTKMGIAKARVKNEPNKKAQIYIATLEIVLEQLEEGLSTLDMYDIWNNALMEVCSIKCESKQNC